MAAIPFMPLYVADYLADAAHLSTAEHGAYLLLIMTYWQRGEALPDDDRKLAKIVGMSGPNWQRARRTIIDFFECRDGKLIHRRVERELSRVRDKALKNRKGGLARAQQMHSERLADAERTLSHTDTDTDIIPFPNGNGPAADPEKVMFDSGVRLLIGAGKSEQQARRIIGKWKNDMGVPEAIAGIGEAVRLGITDPVAWMEGRRKARSGQSFDYVGGPC